MAFAETVRELLTALASGAEPPIPAGGGLGRVLREAGPTARQAVAVLVDRWFRTSTLSELPLNRADLDEDEKLHATLSEHVVAKRRWQELSTNESTFYRYRRTAMGAFAEHLWSEIQDRPVPSNRPLPEYQRFIGREREIATLLRLLDEPGGTIVGIEGPGGSGKTALLHAVADACEVAGRAWQPVSADTHHSVPLFDAFVWVACTDGSGLAMVLEAVARTLDYPGLLARGLEDRRQAVRDLLSKRAVLLLVDDVDRGDAAVLAFLADLPGRSRALVTGRRRLPSEVRALLPDPLGPDAVRELVLAEAERQGAPEMGRALAGAEDPLTAAARYPLLAGWAVAQLRRGQTVERVRQRLARAEGEVFGEMFAASIAGLRPPAHDLLATLPLLVAPAYRATLLAAGGESAEGALDELLETSLLEASGPPTDEARQYELHAVTRSFVMAHLPLPATLQRCALARLAEHYAGLSEIWGGAAFNWRSFRRLERELPNIMAVLEASSAQAREREADPPGAVFDRAILQLAHGLRNVFSLGGAWSEGLVLFHRAIEAARRLDDARAEGWNLYRLGVLHYELGSGGYAEVAQRAREAVEILGNAGDLRGRGHALRLLGRATRARGNNAEAERLLMQAEALLAEHGHGDDVAIVRASRADLLRLSGRLDSARELYEAVLGMDLRDAVTEANVRKDLGEIALSCGELEHAQYAFEAAEALAAPAGARAIVAHSRLGQARVAQRRGDPPRAQSLARDAADLFERLGDLDRAYEARSVVA
ncbi:MAG: AAA family ATPase [Chloroflexi bacterium]|nr:AAA family ATPase [Chloroflexota bacterium]MBV9894026.1 AAA family ATPase [Chloroflexota bacterium]